MAVKEPQANSKAARVAFDETASDFTSEYLFDLDRVKALGKGRVDLTIGSALDIFGGDIPFADVLAWQAREDASADH